MLNERKLTERELESREVVLQGLLQNKQNLVKKYGKDAEKVMYGIATKKAKTKVESMNKDKIKELIVKALTNEASVDDVIDPADYGLIGAGYLAGFGKEHTLNLDQLEELGRKIEKQLYKGDFKKAKAKFVKEDNDPSGEYLEGDPDEKVMGEDNNKELKGQEMVDYIMKRFNWSEEKTLNYLADNFGKNKQDDGPKEKDPRYIAYLRRSGRDEYADELERKMNEVGGYNRKGEKVEDDDNEKGLKSRPQAGIGNLFKEGHGLDQGDIDILQKFIDGKDMDVIPLKRVLKFIVKSNILQDKTKDLSKVDEKIDFDEVLNLRGIKAELEKEIEQLFRDMEQEAEPEGGPIADRYGNELNKLEDRLYKVQKQINDYDMNEINDQSSFDFANPTGGETLDPIPRKVGKGTGKSYINRPSGPAKFPESLAEKALPVIRKKLGKVPKAKKVTSKQKMKLPSGMVNYMNFTESVLEKLTKKNDVGDYVDDFNKSDAKQFKGKSDKKKKQMAVAAYLSKQND